MPSFTLIPSEAGSPIKFTAAVPVDDMTGKGSATKTSRVGAVFARKTSQFKKISGGPIADRTKEHLGTSDGGVIALRRRLLNAARNLQRGYEPPEPRCSGAYRVHPLADLARRDVSFDEVVRTAIPISQSAPV